MNLTAFAFGLVLERKQKLPEIVDALGPELQELLDKHGADLNARALLWALAKKESRLGDIGWYPRVERAYAPGGAWHREHVVDLYRAFGPAAAASYSSWQLMYPVAVELGFRSHPYALADDATAAPFVLAYLDVRSLRRGDRSVEQIADTYNSGSSRDAFVPVEYVKAVREFYDGAIAQLRDGLPLIP